jgi:hypothetical protein
VSFEQQRFVSDCIDIFRKNDEECLAYMRNNSSTVEFLETIISFDNSNELVFVFRRVSLMSTADSMSINDRLYRRTNILYELHHGTTIVVASLKFIIQKLAFEFATDAKFSPLETPYSFTSIQTWVEVRKVNKIIFVRLT